MVDNIILLAIGAVLGWLATNWIGKPISDARDKRIKALQAVEQNSYVGGAASDERVVAARASLNEAASALRSISRGHSWLVRLYCRLTGYDLEAAANCLIKLHNMTGSYGYDDEGRQLIIDAIYVFLHADQHLGPERVNEIKSQVDREKRLSKVKDI
jgi:hypothetical protein